MSAEMLTGLKDAIRDTVDHTLWRGKERPLRVALEYSREL
jgi:hypothetical protein